MKAKRIAVLTVCLLALLGAAAALATRQALPGWESPRLIPAVQSREIRQEILRAADVCGDLFTGPDTLSRAEIDAIEERLTGADFSVLDSDENYPSFLENPESLLDFWAAASSGKNGWAAVLQVEETGGFSHLFFSKTGENAYFVRTSVIFDAENRPMVSACETLPIFDMLLSGDGCFYYQVCPEDPHYITYNEIRTESVDRDLYDLNRQYIQSVGYQFTNLFLCDWQEGNFGALSFADVFEYLYAIRTGEPLDTSRFPYQPQPTRFFIPAALFEETVTAFFDISRESLRKAAFYDPAADSYPWRPRFGDDVTTWKYPMCESQVTACLPNADGTLTLLVRVTSPDVIPDALFTHEVTVRPGTGGSFQYVGNRVTFVGDRGLPPSMTRFALDNGK